MKLKLNHWTFLSVVIAVLLAKGTTSYADECATFFWTGSQTSPVERYLPRYLIGQGLEDIHMEQIVGPRIRVKWSTQAARCIASSSSYGYFSHPDFSQTACKQGESCFPGTRAKTTRERLSDILDVAQQLATPNADATYQANLAVARASSYMVIDSMGGPLLTAAFFTDLVAQYNHFIEQATITLDSALPLAVRTAVMDDLCAPENVEHMTELQDQCVDNDHFCALQDLYNTINFCVAYQSGAALDSNVARVTAARNGLISERDRLSHERDQIVALWDQIQALRPASLADLPPSCNIRFPFGTAQLQPSDFAAGHYGAELRYLYGDWEWSDLGLVSNTIKASAYVKGVTSLVHDCIGDARYGRLDFKRRRVTGTAGESRNETSKEYYTRVLADLVKVRRQLADIEMNYATLMHTHAPLVPDAEISTHKTLVSDTVLRLRELIANRATGIGWVVVLMQDFMDASERYTLAQETTRGLAITLLHQYPHFRDSVINMLITNAQSVIDQYGEFFSVERRSNLELLLSRAALISTDNIDNAISDITDIADGLQSEFDKMWDNNNQPLVQLASTLKFLFGACQSASPQHPFLSYFGDLPVAAQIIKKGSDAQFCN